MPKLKPAQKAVFVRACQAVVTLLAHDGWLTQSQADTLARLAAAL